LEDALVVAPAADAVHDGFGGHQLVRRLLLLRRRPEALVGLDDVGDLALEVQELLVLVEGLRDAVALAVGGRVEARRRPAGQGRPSGRGGFHAP